MMIFIVPDALVREHRVHSCFRPFTTSGTRGRVCDPARPTAFWSLVV
jgi:hypothetical protein